MGSAPKRMVAGTAVMVLGTGLVSFSLLPGAGAATIPARTTVVDSRPIVGMAATSGPGREPGTRSRPGQL